MLVPPALALPLRRLLLAPALASALAFALSACERPPLDDVPPALEVLSPDLGDVLLNARLALDLRVVAPGGAERLTVRGAEAVLDPVRQRYTAALELAPGLNVLPVEITVRSGAVTRDTLYAVYLPARSGRYTAAALPGGGRTGHAATSLDSQTALLSGGFDEAGAARADGVVVRTQGSLFGFEAVSTGTPRGGHTATRLPDGRVLLLGGARAENPASAAQLVLQTEVFDPATGTTRAVAVSGEGVPRAFHTTEALTTPDGRFVLHVYGGRGVLPGGAFGTLSTVAILEWEPTADGGRLVTRTPAGGAGSFPPASGHAQAPLLGGGRPESLVAGLYTAAGPPVPVGFRFVYAAPGAQYPFNVTRREAARPRAPRERATLTRLGEGLAVLAGGRDAEGRPVAFRELYAAGADRYFRFPDAADLVTPRSGHTATPFAPARTLVAGGRDAQGRVLADLEILLR
ncbi:MAG: hypothetical protein ACK41D_10705 [Rubricoccaceae bacterium]